MAYTFKQALNSLPKVNGGPKPVITAPFTAPGTGLPTIPAFKGTAAPKPAPFVGIGPQVTGNRVAAGGGGGGGNVLGVTADPAAVAQAAAIAEEIRKKAEDEAKRGKLRGEGSKYLDELYNIYNDIISKIEQTGKDSKDRINKSYGTKFAEQSDLMNEGMYTSDASNAANNLANSSWMSFDRSKIRKAKEANDAILQDKQNEDLATIGKMVSEDTAKWNADKQGIDRSRQMLNDTQDLTELTNTVNTLDATKRNSGAAAAKYGTQGEFVSKANSLGTFDTAGLEKTLQSVVANASASPASKQATMEDLINGSAADEAKKKELKNKYSQVV